MWDALRKECGNKTLANQTIACIKLKTFGLHETLKFNGKSPKASQWWEDITLTHYGRFVSATT